jgi:signal transduction histidine kinase
MADPARPRRTHFLVLALGLALTALSTYGFRRSVEERDLARFRSEVQTALERIQGRLDTSVDLLVATRSFVTASGTVDGGEFRDFVNSLEMPRRYPGSQGIGYTVRIPAAERPAIEARQRRAGNPSFRIWPEGPRDEYTAVLFLEPLDRRNQAALGYDMATDPVRRAAMERARDEGMPAATRKVRLVQEIDAEKQPGFLVYLPVYRRPEPHTLEGRRASLIGYVYSPFRAGDLIAGIFGADAEGRPLAFELYDGSAMDEAARLARVGQISDDSPRFQTRSQIRFAGTTWTVAFRSTPFFETASNRALAGFIATLGALASFALFLVTRAQGKAAAEAVAQRNNLHALFDQAPAAIAIVRGPDLVYELSNPLNQQLGQGRPRVGRPVREVLPELEAQGLLELLERVYRTGEPFVGYEVPVHLKLPAGGDRTLYLNGTYQPFRGPDGQVEGVMAFAYEVTEQALARRKVEALAEDLKRAVRIRDDFLSIAGHELKTPLSALKLHIQSLQQHAEKGLFGAPDPRLGERLAKASNQVSRLTRLVSELLDVSRISTGRLDLQLEDVDLPELLGDVIDRFSEELNRSGCRISLRSAAHVRGAWDRLRLDQVITNLIGNAIKYGSGKPIEVSVEEQSEVARLTVRDHGIGIPPEDKDRIFGRFERAVSERHYGGLGLGLWITHQIVQAHGGTIALQSAPGEGSSFTVELPRRPPEACA